ncbi:MAG: gliding motility-associated C-terminal domain-containing protein [Flavobacteriales bacterium]|nr:gliding motility-associated C-terminal domain-containing protein [Flavobacteriales bacterium]
MSTWTSTDSVQVVGDTTITIYVQDISGNIDSCSTTLTVSDSNPPVALCQDATIYLDAAGNATIVAADIDGGSTDNGTIVSLVASQTSFDCSNLGANNVTLTVTDDGGNSEDCVAIVTVLDTIAPTVVCQNIDAFLDASGNVTITGADLNGGSSDNCGTGSLTFSASTASFDCSNLGPQTVTLTVTDASGNVSTCDASVTVQDTIIPTLACAPATVNIDANGWAVFTASALATWSDNCASGMSAWTSTDSVQVVGDTTITIYAQDISGNIDSCSTTLTVSDSNPPVALCQNATIYLDASGNASIVASDIDGGSTDNGTIVSLVASQTSFDCSNIGANNVTLTLIDDGGNTASCTAVVIVLDTIAPTVVCQNASIYLDETGNVNVGPLDILVSGTHNCSATGATTSVSVIETAGTHTISVTVTDQSGNQSFCSAIVTVLDTIRPEVNCNVLGGLVVYLDANGTVTVPAEDLDGGSTDNDSIVSYASSQTIFDCSDIGNNSVSFTVTDAAGNTAMCTTVVTVLDTIAPAVICQSLTAELGPDGQAVINAIDMDNGSWDNCGSSALTYTTDITSISTPGSHVVTLTVTDASGNGSTCTATIFVEDNTPPVAVCQPTTIHLDENGNASIVVTDIDGGSMDNGGIVNLSASQTAFECGDLGSNEVTLTVTDASGNSAECVAVVTVLDTIAPTAMCQNISVVLDQNGNATILADDLVASSADNCGTSTLAYTASTTAFTSAGIHSVTLTVTDASGNSTSCTASVTVIASNEPPVALCQPVTIYLDASGNASIVAADVDGGSTDDIGIVNMTVSHTSFNCDQLGENTVILTVYDAAGLSSNCTALVTVLDTLGPVVNCASITITLNEQGEASIAATDIDGGSTDNCGIVTWSLSVEQFTVAGTYTASLTVTDGSGNSSTCIATVTVEEPKETLTIPNGFSPNGDGIADTWEIKGLEAYPTNSLSIFNRWGSKIHEAAPYLNDWTGFSTVKATLPGELPAGTYFFVLELGDGEDARTGYIQVNR